MHGAMVEGSRVTRVAGEALPAFRLVKANGSTERSVVYADAGDELEVSGSTVIDGASGAAIPVLCANAQGTRKLTAAGAIAVNGKIKCANDGKVQAAGTGEGIAVIGKWVGPAVTTDGDIGEAEMYPSPRIQTLA